MTNQTNQTICVFTICSASHIHQSIVSLHSAQKNISNNYQTFLIICCIDKVSENSKTKIKQNFDIEILLLDAVTEENVQKSIDKYKENKDALRWSNKPNLLLYLINKYDIVFYIDSDIYFVNNWYDLIEQTNKGILLTPHNRDILPYSSQYNYLFTDGYFNGGFIGANKLGKDALRWWSDVVLWNCCKDFNKGLYDDQKYLDIMALEFNEVVNICKNKGCNIAQWNINRDDVKNANPIFFHFSDININDNNILTKNYKKFKEEIELFN